MTLACLESPIVEGPFFPGLLPSEGVVEKVARARRRQEEEEGEDRSELDVRAANIFAREGRRW